MTGIASRSRFSAVKGGVLATALMALIVVACQPDHPTGPYLAGEVSLAKGGAGGGGGGGSVGPTITATDPASTVQDTTLDVAIIGTGFTNGAKATWSLAGDTTQIIVKSTKVVSADRIIARISVPVTAAVGSYDVIVTLSNGKKGVGAEMFTVETRPFYRFRFISGITAAGDGEITSDWFPAEGIRLKVNNPWISLGFNDVTINLNNFTHGDVTLGQCAYFISRFALPLDIVNWDIGTTTRSYAGTWRGTVNIGSGYLAFDGDRVVGGVVVPAAGGIHNAVTQDNVTFETTGPNDDWFRQEVRNAPLKFSGISSPDGAPTTNSELACVNYTIEARKVTLIP
jgi:hypothetical protein